MMTPKQKAARQADEIEKSLTEDTLPVGKRKALERELISIGDNLAEGCYSDDPDDGIDWSDCPGIASGKAPEPEYLTFYCPEMTYKLHYKNDEGESTHDDFIPRDIIEPYFDQISEAIKRERPMTFEYPGILEVTPGVELHDGKLFGTLTVSSYGKLSTWDTEYLCELLAGLANEFSTWFKDCKMETDGGDLYVAFCTGTEPLQSETAFKNHRYVERHNLAFDSVRFYASESSAFLRMMYYNPDSNAGGQLVQNDLSLDTLRDAVDECETEEQFWDRLDERARQYLTDIDTPDFVCEASYFVDEPCDFSGCDHYAMEKIKAWVNQQCTETQGMSLS